MGVFDTVVQVALKQIWNEHVTGKAINKIINDAKDKAETEIDKEKDIENEKKENN